MSDLALQPTLDKTFDNTYFECRVSYELGDENLAMIEKVVTETWPPKDESGAQPKIRVERKYCFNYYYYHLLRLLMVYRVGFELM